MTIEVRKEHPPLPNEVTVIPVVCAVIIRDRKCLIGKRLPEGSSGGKWEFPGGKLEAGETPQQALRREINEELGLDVEVLGWLGRGEARMEQKLIVLDAYHAALSNELFFQESTAHSELCWASSLELSSRDWAEADVPLVPRVLELLAEANPE